MARFYAEVCSAVFLNACLRACIPSPLSSSMSDLIILSTKTNTRHPCDLLPANLLLKLVSFCFLHLGPLAQKGKEEGKKGKEERKKISQKVVTTKMVVFILFKMC